MEGVKNVKKNQVHRQDGEIVLISRRKKLFKKYTPQSKEPVITFLLLVIFFLTNLFANSYLVTSAETQSNIFLVADSLESSSIMNSFMESAFFTAIVSQTLTYMDSIPSRDINELFYSNADSLFKPGAENLFNNFRA